MDYFVSSVRKNGIAKPQLQRLQCFCRFCLDWDGNRNNSGITGNGTARNGNYLI